MAYAEIAVGAPGLQSRTFSYAIPPSLPLAPGHLVWVPFGAQILPGIVFTLTSSPAVEAVKEIHRLVTPEPVLFPYQLALARWISEYYLCTLYEAASLMFPPGIPQRVRVMVALAPQPLWPSQLTPLQEQVVRWLQRRRSTGLEEVRRSFPRRRDYEALEQLVGKGVVVKTLRWPRAPWGSRYLRWVRLLPEGKVASGGEELLPRAPRQRALLLWLRQQQGPVGEQEIRHQGFSWPVVASLERQGWLSVGATEVFRDPLAGRSFAPPLVLPLTSAQEEAWQQLHQALRTTVGREPRIFLLHGVTGSGKTELYLRAVEESRAQGKGSLCLVPEIALTPQTVERVSSRFPGTVALWHSRLSPREQRDGWHRVRRGDLQVVVGSRSALFAPVPRLGLIVLDEEHEWTYKQHEPAPRYHTREVACKLAELTGAVVILGSATPSVESFLRARHGSYRLLSLPQRVPLGRASPRRRTVLQPETRLPQVTIVDLRQELRRGRHGLLSAPLQEALGETLHQGEQAILFLNRRGTAAFVQCRACGFVPHCRRCAVALTFHEGRGLLCHQCNAQASFPERCPACEEGALRPFGAGTQGVEREVARLFPQARCLRWDRDAVTAPQAHEALLERFRRGDAHVLVGTQMLAKGLDLPGVTLVGVIAADLSLHQPDFRAAERTFQLLAQVAGRAGRGPLPGRVLIQTYRPEHYAVAAASHQDYLAFLEAELPFRQEQRLPPFSSLVRLVYTHPGFPSGLREGERVAAQLRRSLEEGAFGDIEVVGPSPCPLARLRGRYRWQVLLRGREIQPLLRQFRLPQGWTIDVDPISMV